MLVNSRRYLLAGLVAGALSLTAATSASADTIADKDTFVPIVRINGATGVFRTDVWIFNPDPTKKAVVDLYFTPAETDGTNSPGKRITPDLAARETVSLVDVLSSVFGVTSGYGVLEVKSDVAVLVTSNTYNIAGAVAGTYGQYSPGQPTRNALGFDDSVYGDLYITGLTNSSSLRTNAVIINPSGQSLEAGVQLVDAVGQIYGTRIYTVKPYSMLQLNDVFGSEFSTFRPPAAGNPYRLNLFVNLGNGAKILGYATVTDTRTGDPYLIVAQQMQKP